MAVLPGGLVGQSATALLLLGLVFHLIYMWSIFDIYFRSPLVHGMQQHRVNTHQPPAKRIVLFSADGLRADRLFDEYEHAGYLDDATRSTIKELLSSPQSNSKTTLAPFLHSICLERGSCGISHTRVPTESRPGHVAMIAGFYEDVSAVTKGWKMNPVEFDSLFNQSSHTWSFGSPDILPMFKEGATDKSKIEVYNYAEEKEKFDGDAIGLDEWVFARVNEMMDGAERASSARVGSTNQAEDAFNPEYSESQLAEMLKQDGSVIFLHLLGLDTNGHGFRPNSREYLKNIQYVDNEIRKFSERLERFFGNDGRTAYVFTSDHGMQDRGVHGDGDPQNTQTPLIAWGAGVAGPKSTPTVNLSGHAKDKDSEHWGRLQSVPRKDVNQADISPLMAALIGVNFPANSVGELPIDYLDDAYSVDFKARAALVNARQIYEQYVVKNHEKQATEIFFQPYKELVDAESRLADIENRLIVAEKQHEKAEKQCLDLIEDCLDGLRYLQTYDWLFLRTLVSAGFLGWIAYSLVHIFSAYTIAESERRPGGSLGTYLATIVGTVLFYVIISKRSPAMYYAYAVFPLFFWSQVLNNLHVFGQVISRLSTIPAARRPDSLMRRFPSLKYVVALGIVAGYVIVLEALVASYFHRSVLTAMFAVAAIWPFVFMNSSVRRSLPTFALLMWFMSCIATGSFMLLDVVLWVDIPLLILGGVVIASTGLFALNHLGDIMAAARGAIPAYRTAFRVLVFQIVLVIATTALVVATTVLAASIAKMKQANEEPGMVNIVLTWIFFVLTWTIFVVAPAVPFVHGRHTAQHFVHRLVTIYLAFAPPFILMSMSYEVLFYGCFGVVLFLWVIIERQQYASSQTALAHPQPTIVTPHSNGNGSVNGRPAPLQAKHRSLRLSDARTVLFFLFFINVAFFGTGNVASISSFSLEPVYRFVSGFSPFLMGALLIVKIIIPFILVSSAFGVLNKSLELPPMSLSTLVLGTTDVMTLNFFFLVRDDGSWLEIGSSISHFVIASCFVVLTALLFALSHVMVGTVLVPSVATEEEARKRA